MRAVGNLDRFWFGEEERCYTHKREILFLIDWKYGVFILKLCVTLSLKQKSCTSHMLQISIKLNSKTNFGVQSVSNVIV